jgi:hypothetical protein
LPLIVNGIDRSASQAEICRIVRRVFERSTDACSWLRPGDTVLLKVALNAPDPYPATTSPLAIRAVAEALRERGARVLVGDMPGMEHVLLDQQGSRRQSSRSCFEHSGMSAGATVEFIGFEERGWDEGFFHTPPRADELGKAHLPRAPRPKRAILIVLFRPPWLSTPHRPPRISPAAIGCQGGKDGTWTRFAASIRFLPVSATPPAAMPAD